MLMKAHQEFGEAIASLRSAYLAEIERLACDLRPYFVAGRLRGLAEGDEDSSLSPMFVLVRIVSARFRLGEEDATPRACAILACSPSTDATADDGATTEQWAADAAAWDVIRLARRGGWYVADADEEPTPESLGEAA